MAELALIYDKDSGNVKAGLIGTDQIGSGQITAEKIYDGDPFTIQQPTPESLKHLPHGLNYATSAILPMAVDASGYMFFNAVWPDNTVTSAKLASGAVGIPHIYHGAVISAKIGANVIATPHILNQGILSASIGAGIVGTPHLANQAVISAKIGALAVGIPHLAALAVTEAKIGAGAVTSGKIGVNAIGGVHILDGSIVSGDIAALAIGQGHLANQAVISAKIGANVIATPHIANQGILSASIGAGIVDTPHLANQAITSGKLASGVVGITHIAPFASGSMIVGRGTAAMPIVQARLAAIEFIIDGGRSVITSGKHGDYEIPFPAEINRVTLLGDQSGNININILKNSYANYPPTLANSICSGGLVPHTSGNIKYQDAILSGWNKVIASGDILAFYAGDASSIQRCTISLGAYR